MLREKTVSRSSSSQHRRATRVASGTGRPMWAPWTRSRRWFTRREATRSPMAKLRASITLDLPSGQPGLGGGGDDLIGWQDETIATGVPQLEGKGVLDAEVVGPVDAAAAGLLPLMRGVAAGVAVGVHEQLGVGVDGDEGLEVAVATDQLHHVLHLHLGVSRAAVEGVGARVAAGPGAWRQRDDTDTFLLGSTPRHGEPGFTERVLRHIRF
ncbi:hypothetical protein EYF80_012528 [Liparis tanakae]|uniref:Uncharacterized protein n=1 Tax=Liparis tanakae TaxID=230148 RepID=A0A4Z2IHK8_9TELE|nr:hypothetical protein EYF80_012528 [Liparis tanakae]